MWSTGKCELVGTYEVSGEALGLPVIKVILSR